MSVARVGIHSFIHSLARIHRVAVVTSLVGSHRRRDLSIGAAQTSGQNPRRHHLLFFF